MPMTIRRTPAIIVTMSRPESPNLGKDARDNDDKRARWAADLNARTTQRRDEKSGDDSRVQTGLWRYARSDAERHRKGQGN